MQDSGRVHRFRHHAVAGVNWRPTRFVEEVPSLRICDLCRMIPKRIVVLPCSHTLCPSCHQIASSQSVGERCPLDLDPYDQADCGLHDLPTRISNAMKVHCWNEAHGCRFEGTMEYMLRHYEKECEFHSTECTRCGDVVLHRELPTHYMAECTTRVPSARAQNTSPESTAPTLGAEDKSSESAAVRLQDGIVSLQAKTLFRDPSNDEQPPAVESKTEEPAYQHQGSPSAVAARGVVGSSPENTNEGVTGVAGATSSVLLQEPASRRNATEEVDASSMSCAEGSTPSRRPDFFNNLPAQVLADMRKAGVLDYPQYAFTGRADRNVKCSFYLTKLPPTTECSWRELKWPVEYVLAIENIPEVMLTKPKNTLCKLTVLHTRDAYFNLEVHRSACSLSLQAEFYGMLEGFQCTAPSLAVDASSGNNRWLMQLRCVERFRGLKPDHSYLHFRSTFDIAYEELLRNDGVLNSSYRFRIAFPAKEKSAG